MKSALFPQNLFVESLPDLRHLNDRYEINQIEYYLHMKYIFHIKYNVSFEYANRR